MTRLMCIVDEWCEDIKWLWGRIKFKWPCKGPKYGDIVTYAGHYYENGSKYYYLLEWPPCTGDNGFEAKWFIPLSEEDVEEKQEKELIKHPQ